MAAEIDSDEQLLVEAYTVDSKKGRGLRAKTLIHAGTVVLEEYPYAFILNEEQLKLRCGHCLRAFTSDRIREDGLRACRTCKQTFYCSKTCQVSGSVDHYYECKLLRAQSMDHAEVTLRLVAKIIIQTKEQDGKKNSSSTSGFPSSLRDLCSRQLSTRAQEYIQRLFHQYEKGWRGKFRSRLFPIGDRRILDVFQKLVANDFSMYDEMKRTVIGEAIYLRASLLNHSCEPNCTFVFDGRRLSVRAIRRIEAGEECSISYVSTLLPTRLRQEKLRSVYGFVCQCQRCLDTTRDSLMLCVKCPNRTCPDPVLPVQDGCFQMCHTCHSIISSLEHSTAVEGMEAFTEEILQEVRKSQQEVAELNSYQNDSRLAVILRQCQRQQSSLLHPTHHACLRLGLEAMQTFSRLAWWGEALDASQGILEGLRLHLSPEDPYLAFFLLKLSIVHINLGNDSLAQRLLNQTIPLLEKAYGESHPVTQHARALSQSSS
ncbi:N-lysine methyltransferase SMYD2-like [Diadema antillarum]|uniref:N-lysine methyltransferase SMYD2-like n=1 Tax=Diadema antillarum TaxID=105358 RepID=UPI003A8638B3